jgi:hypothetical protein
MVNFLICLTITGNKGLGNRVSFRMGKKLSISLSASSYSIAALYYTVEIVARENSVLLSRSRRSHHPAVEIYQRPAVVVHTGRIFTNFQEALLTVC